MIERLAIFSIICDILILSLFFFHIAFRTKRINEEVHEINKKVVNCPNRYRRVK